MSQINYEVQDEDAKARMLSISEKIGGALKVGWGFVLMIFEHGERGKAVFYTSSANRSDVVKVLQEWIDRQGEKGLNPENPTSKGLSHQWHKIAALLVAKAGGEVLITSEDLRALERPGGINVLAHDGAAGLALKIVDDATADAMAATDKKARLVSGTRTEVPR